MSFQWTLYCVGNICIEEMEIAEDLWGKAGAS